MLQSTTLFRAIPPLARKSADTTFRDRVAVKVDLEPRIIESEAT